jgi:hypothetical protein
MLEQVCDPPVGTADAVPDAAAAGGTVAASGADDAATHPRTVWSRVPPRQLPDAYGCGRIPGFWFTLNLPYNYLFEIHRFHRATRQLAGPLSLATCATKRDAQMAADSWVDPLDAERRDAVDARCAWALDNPDLVVTLHAIRAELITRYLISEVVPPDPQRPFQYWLRFEFGKSGNPHAHGLCFVPGNPEFDLVVKDLATLQRILKEEARHAEDRDLRTWEEAERQVADFYEPYISERHPCKDAAGAPLWSFAEPLYTLVVEGVRFPECAKPQTVNLLRELELAFAEDPERPTREPDTSRLKYLLLALIESGQRHTGHGHQPPRPDDPCARRAKKGPAAERVYCRYLFPRELRPPREDGKRGVVEDDPYREELRNLFLERNDTLLNNFEPHLLLANLGNIDWRALLNLWSVLEYLTSTPRRAGRRVGTSGRSSRRSSSTSSSGRWRTACTTCGGARS